MLAEYFASNQHFISLGYLHVSVMLNCFLVILLILLIMLILIPFNKGLFRDSEISLKYISGGDCTERICSMN